MTAEHNGMNGHKSSEGHGEFHRVTEEPADLVLRRVLDGLGREGLHQAVEHLTAHIRARPDHTDALSTRGLLYSELGEHLRAAEDYSRVIDLAPGDSYAYFQRARAHDQLDEHRSAVDDYRHRHPPRS